MSVLALLTISSCSSQYPYLNKSKAIKPSATTHADYRYLIGPGDSLSIFVWKNPEVSTTVTVRPDGIINAPLVDDLKVSDKTPAAIAREIEQVLSKFIREPIVTVTVAGFVGPYHDQVRVIGEASKPQSLPYKEDMTLLDVIIAVGGLTEFADGNNAVLSRVVKGKYQQYTVRMDDLLQAGDMNENVDILPGDILVIPESWF
ncbi:MAG: polysaccharide biosynthesis/export family protein [Gammaproteobacteria bacterium]|nr:polysaccharide biosynthesis/export family protein [Gammaproteobacteria bacterium]